MALCLLLSVRLAVVGPGGVGKTLVASSLAIYLRLWAGSAVFVDAGDGSGASLLRGKVPVAADPEEAGRALYAVVDTPPCAVPEADGYVVVLEPRHLKRWRAAAGAVAVVNKSLWPLGLHLPYSRGVERAVAAGVHPLLAAGLGAFKKKAVEAARAAVEGAAGGDQAALSEALKRLGDCAPSRKRQAPAGSVKELTLAEAARALGVRPRWPDLWSLAELCGDPVYCYARLVEVWAKGGGRARRAVLGAVMEGRSLEEALDAVVEGLP